MHQQIYVKGDKEREKVVSEIEKERKKEENREILFIYTQILFLVFKSHKLDKQTFV